MKNHFTKSAITIAVLALLLTTLTVVNAEWNNAPSNPPQNNAPTPINVGSDGQIKLGGLTVGSGSGVLSALIAVNGAIVAGSDAVISSGSSAEVKALDFRTMGKVGAGQYCDENGQNCVDGSNLGSGGGSGGGSDGIPSGAVMAFDLSSCPSGWSAYSNGAGRFIIGVGTPPGTTIAKNLGDKGGTWRSNVATTRYDYHNTGDNSPLTYVAEGNLVDPYVALLYCKKN